MMSYWSELARPIVLPPTGTRRPCCAPRRPTRPYVAGESIEGLKTSLGPDFTLVDLDCDHMVPLARPDETAAAVRKLLRR